MRHNFFPTQGFKAKRFSTFWIIRFLCPLFFIAPIVLVKPSICLGSEIIVRLSGKIDYPGDFSLLSETIQLKKICFLGINAKGRIDKQFLDFISSQGPPEGDYQVAPPFPVEQWPVKSFNKGGALRLKIITGPGLEILKLSKKNGIAVHGRDFYPLLEDIINKTAMINFHNDSLFERLEKHWGLLRISNWDMGRLADTWVKMNRPPAHWKAKVIRVSPQEIKKLCQPPETTRTLD